MSGKKTSEQLTLLPAGSHASLTVLPGSEEARQMTATSGRSLAASLPNSDPATSLLRTFLESEPPTSTRCYLTWKTKATPAGRLIFRLSPSMPRTDGTESSLWATPATADAVGSHGGGQGRSLRTDIHNYKRGLFPTPRAGKVTNEEEVTWRKRQMAGKVATPPLALAARLFPTANSRDWKDVGDLSGVPENSLLPRVVQRMEREMYPTPTARDGKSGRGRAKRQYSELTPRIERQAVSGSLNPVWVSWLMGFPLNWLEDSFEWLRESLIGSRSSEHSETP